MYIIYSASISKNGQDQKKVGYAHTAFVSELGSWNLLTRTNTKPQFIRYVSRLFYLRSLTLPDNA